LQTQDRENIPPSGVQDSEKTSVCEKTNIDSLNGGGDKTTENNKRLLNADDNVANKQLKTS